MLASITPLGERGRNQPFGVTVTAYVVGSVLAAAALGAVVGALGAVLVGDRSTTARLVVGAGLAVVAALVDRRPGDVPSWHRQVNEDWLASYRGWVYGAGFGAQLGLGVVTIVTTASVYLLWIGVFLAGHAGLGAAVGAVFGLVRALPVLASVRVRTPAAVGARVGTFDRWDGSFRGMTVVAEVCAAVVLVSVAVV